MIFHIKNHTFISTNYTSHSLRMHFFPILYYHQLRADQVLKLSFIRYISHELRTPLNSISLGLDYLLKQLEDPSRSNHDITGELEVVTDLKICCVECVHVLTNLLTYDTIESAMLALVTTSFGVKTLVEEAMAPYVLQVRYTYMYVYKCNTTA